MPRKCFSEFSRPNFFPNCFYGPNLQTSTRGMPMILFYDFHFRVVRTTSPFNLSMHQDEFCLGQIPPEAFEWLSLLLLLETMTKNPRPTRAEVLYTRGEYPSCKLIPNTNLLIQASSIDFFVLSPCSPSVVVLPPTTSAIPTWQQAPLQPALDVSSKRGRNKSFNIPLSGSSLILFLFFVLIFYGIDIISLGVFCIFLYLYSITFLLRRGESVVSPSSLRSAMCATLCLRVLTARCCPSGGQPPMPSNPRSLQNPLNPPHLTSAHLRVQITDLSR